MKSTFLKWKQANTQLLPLKRLNLIPVLMLSTYGTGNPDNFTLTEITSIADWLRININPNELALWFTPKAPNEIQLNEIKKHIPNIVSVAFQPGISLPLQYSRAAQDMWGGETAGSTNTIWSNSPKSCGIVGKKLLTQWVNERVIEQRQFTFFLHNVGWDYDYPSDPVCDHLIFPQDDANTNDPLPTGRIGLSHDVITSIYSGNMSNFGGFASDLWITNQNGKIQDLVRQPDGSTLDQSIYTALKQNKRYTGRYSEPLDEISQIYKMYTPTPLPGDLDKNGKVDIFDYNLFVGNFGNTTCGNVADIDGTCTVDIFDYNILVGNFGKTQ